MITHNSLQDGQFVYTAKVQTKGCKKKSLFSVEKYDVRNKGGDICIKTTGNYHTTNISENRHYFYSALECIMDSLEDTISTLNWKVKAKADNIKKLHEFRELEHKYSMLMSYIPSISAERLIDGSIIPEKTVINRQIDVTNLMKKAKDLINLINESKFEEKKITVEMLNDFVMKKLTDESFTDATNLGFSYLISEQI